MSVQPLGGRKGAFDSPLRRREGENFSAMGKRHAFIELLMPVCVVCVCVCVYGDGEEEKLL